MSYKNEASNICESRKIGKEASNVYYEYTIEIQNSPSIIELFIGVVLSIFVFLNYAEDGLFISKNWNIITVTVWMLILAHVIKKIFWDIKRETILIVRSLGFQVTTTYNSNFESLTYIPWQSIDDVIINEVILMQRVIYYLAVLVSSNHGSEKKSIIPLFLHAKPRLADLKEIYRNIQLVLNH